MRRLILLLLIAAPCLAQWSNPANRRYAEKTPLQYTFGPLTAVAPFNNAPNFSTATTAGLQPSGLIISNNTFTSTGNFSVLEQTSPATTFSVASNVGTITSTANSVYLLGDSAVSFTAPTVFSQIEITSNGDTNSEFGLTISNASGSTYVMADMYHSSNCNLVVYTGGSYQNIQLTSCSLPSTPWYLGLSLTGNYACFWQSTNGSTWTAYACGGTASYYNFQTSGNLSGFTAAIRVVSSSSTPWKVSNWKTGAFGGVSVRDVSLVTYADGRPYMQGSVAYFTASTCSPGGGAASSYCYDGVYTYDVIAGTLAEIGEIWNTRSGVLEGDLASHLVYDPGNGNYRYMVGGWGNNSLPPTYYGAWAKSSIDPLAGGISLLTATTTMSLPGSGTSRWDAHFACSQWNYSAGTCGKWIVGYSVNDCSAVQGAYSASDPSANSWTSIGSVTPGTGCIEGTRILRTATTSGSAGVTYDFASGYDSNSENRAFTAYSQSAFGSLGNLNAQIPGGAQNVAHPQIFSYGNTEYFVSFDDVLWKTTSESMGNWVLATAPKYSTATNWPEFASGANAGRFTSGSSASIQSGTISVANGDWVVAVCRGGTTSVSSVGISSSTGIGTFTNLGINIISSGSGTGWDNGFYVKATASASVTLTCTPNVSSTFISITPMVFHPGFTTTVDYTNSAANQTGSTLAVYTSPSFSTTAAGLIIVCADGFFGATTVVPGFIGPYAAAFATGVATGGAVCESTVTPSAESGITANAGNIAGNSAQWAGTIFSFK
jgi:hypothetical protein